MNAVVVNRRREEFDVYIGRGSRWGNPYKIGVHGTRDEVIEMYRRDLLRDVDGGRFEELVRDLAELHGKRLGCYCAPLPCHGDVLARAAAWAADIVRLNEEV